MVNGASAAGTIHYKRVPNNMPEWPRAHVCLNQPAWHTPCRKTLARSRWTSRWGSRASRPGVRGGRGRSGDSWVGCTVCHSKYSTSQKQRNQPFTLSSLIPVFTHIGRCRHVLHGKRQDAHFRKIVTKLESIRYDAKYQNMNTKNLYYFFELAQHKEK